MTYAKRIAIGALLALGLAYTVWRTLPTPPEPPRSAARLEAGPLPVLRLSGTPRQMGEAHGRLLREAIRRWLDRCRPADPGLADFALETCAERFLPALPAEIRDEIEGVAEGAGLTPGEIVFLNTRFELSAFGIASGGKFAGAAAARPGPEVMRAFAPDDLGDGFADLTLLFREETGLAMVALPGMVGGFVGVRGPVGATLLPEAGEGTTVLSGIPWTILLRLVLERPSETLPWKSMSQGTLPIAFGEGRWGAFSLTLAGATYQEAAPGEAPDSAFEAPAPGTERWGVVLRRGPGALEARIDRGGDSVRATLPLPDR